MAHRQIYEVDLAAKGGGQDAHRREERLGLYAWHGHVDVRIVTEPARVDQRPEDVGVGDTQRCAVLLEQTEELGQRGQAFLSTRARCLARARSNTDVSNATVGLPMIPVPVRARISRILWLSFVHKGSERLTSARGRDGVMASGAAESRCWIAGAGMARQETIGAPALSGLIPFSVLQ